MIDTRTTPPLSELSAPTVPELIDALEIIYDHTVTDEVLAPVTLHLKHALAALRALRAVAQGVVLEVDDEHLYFGATVANELHEI